MKAIVYSKYGPPEVLQLKEIEKPKAGPSQMLIRIKATAVNSGDWRLRKADPVMVRFFFGLTKPKKKILGSVLSGVVEETGSDIRHFKAGDEIFGLADLNLGTYAEYISLTEKEALAMKPANLTHHEAAAIPFGAHTALHFLRKAGIEKARTGTFRVLIYGASGAVGTAAVQLAKYFGCEVTGICSTQHVDRVKALGADAVIDYTSEDPYAGSGKFDIIFETVNKASVPKLARKLTGNGTLILASAMIKQSLQGMMMQAGSKRKFLAGMAKATPDDMDFLKTLAETGKLKPVIDRTYPLEEMAAAHAYVQQGHKMGNVAVTI